MEDVLLTDDWLVGNLQSASTACFSQRPVSRFYFAYLLVYFSDIMCVCVGVHVCVFHLDPSTFFLLLIDSLIALELYTH